MSLHVYPLAATDKNGCKPDNPIYNGFFTTMTWNKCLDRLRAEVDAKDIALWLKPLRVKETDEGLELFAPNDILAHRVRDNYLSLIRKACEEIRNRPCAVRLRLSADSSTPKKNRTALPEQPQARLESNVDPRFTFDNFVEGQSNTIAKASALQIAEEPLTQFNPLLLYGSTGLGKTHLLHAIGNRILELQPNAIVYYTHSEQFVNATIRAIKNQEMDQLKQQFRSVDALLIDDIQFFAGKERTQEEFFHTFNSLLELKQRVIITCDRYPKEVNGLKNRLKSRLGWGLSVAIDPPDFETRVAILLQKARQQGIQISDKVAFYIAKKLRSNIRELEGALNTLWANARFTGATIDIEFTKQTLRELFTIHHRQVTIENIQKATANYYNIRLSDLLSKKRTRSIARPRQLAMFLAKELTDKSLPEIGEAFGGRDHTTVLHACRKMEQLFGEEPDYAEDKQKLINLLTE